MIRFAMICGVLVLANLGSAVWAQDTEAGEFYYRQFCVACHGLTGQGDGPAAAALRVPPADLTGLSARNGGRFPMQRVIATIDGRIAPGAHGSDMPVWGSFFAQEADTEGLGLAGSALQTRGRILMLATYLATLQP
ncbi:MAG: c-type cytochrome [Rhodobacter sp.]|nr:c-type cytochrome [Paracoccaceae bacterium]MCC0076702.1 c-type cytochrome [Rhodobacter sp.]